MTSPEPPSSPARVAARPSLAGSAGSAGDNLRMLENLGAGLRPPKSAKRGLRRWPVLVFAGLSLGLLAGFVWLLPSVGSNGVPSAAIAAAPSSVNVAKASDSVPAAPRGGHAVVEPTRTLALASSPARIENVDAVNAAMPASAAATGDPFAALAASAAPAASAASASVVAAAPSAPAKPVQSAAAKPAPKAVKASKPRTEAAPHPTAVATHKPASREAPRTTAGKDPDVDLLAALMAHMSGNGNVAQGAAAPRGSQNKPVDEPTIAKLVQRCQALGGDEGRQCQRRICDGYWGKAQACPAKLASRSP